MAQSESIYKNMSVICPFCNKEMVNQGPEFNWTSVWQDGCCAYSFSRIYNYETEVIEVLHNDLLYRWTKHMITNKKEFNIFCIKEHSFTSLKKYDFWPPFDVERLDKLGVLL